MRTDRCRHLLLRAAYGCMAVLLCAEVLAVPLSWLADVCALPVRDLMKPAHLRWYFRTLGTLLGGSWPALWLALMMTVGALRCSGLWAAARRVLGGHALSYRCRMAFWVSVVCLVLMCTLLLLAPPWGSALPESLGGEYLASPFLPGLLLAGAFCLTLCAWLYALLARTLPRGSMGLQVFVHALRRAPALCLLGLMLPHLCRVWGYILYLI